MATRYVQGGFDLISKMEGDDRRAHVGHNKKCIQENISVTVSELWQIEESMKKMLEVTKNNNLRCFYKT